MRTNRTHDGASALEKAAYGPAVRTALRLGGAFSGARDAIGLILPAHADQVTYKDTVAAVLEEAGLAKVYAIAEAYTSRRGEVDFEEVSTMMKRYDAVVALVPHGTAIPPDLELALDRIEEVAAVNAEHAAEAVKAVLGVLLTADQAERLTMHPPKVWLSALRPGRKIDNVIAKLEAATAARRSDRWEPRVEELAGYGEAASWAKDLATDLADWRAGKIAWRDVDAGLLLSGPPGTGKTIFAGAVARTCGAGFFSASVAEWQARGHLGDLLSAMHRSFKDAGSAAPSILLLDELDAIGDRRSFSGHNAAYENQVVNALLERLDGVRRREGVVVIAATNYVEKIDPALRRPGRLDRHIEIRLPDRKARAQILQMHFREPLTEEELRTVAVATGGYSGADLELMARTARRSARRESRAPSFQDILPLLPADVTVSERQRRASSIHEAGHAVVGTALGVGVVEVVVVARQAGLREPSLGHVSWRRERLHSQSEKAYLDDIAMLLGGMAAERVFLLDQHDGCGGSTGSDLHRATDIATLMLTSLGMGLLCYRAADTGEKLEELRDADPLLRAQIDRLLGEQLGRAEQIVKANRQQVERLVEALEQREVLTEAEVAKLLLSGSAAKKSQRHEASSPGSLDQRAGDISTCKAPVDTVQLLSSTQSAPLSLMKGSLMARGLVGNWNDVLENLFKHRVAKP